MKEDTENMECIGDLSTHEVKPGQIWRNWIDPTDTYEILEVKSRHEVKAKHCYQTLGAIREPRCEISDGYDPWVILHGSVLIKDPGKKDTVKK